MKVLMFKNTKDSDLFLGLRVCYQNLNGVYNQLGIITDIEESDGIKQYVLNNAFVSYVADELKLIE